MVRLAGTYCNSHTGVKELRELHRRALAGRSDTVPVETHRPRRRTFSKLKPEQCEEILARYQSGDRVVDIARAFNVTEWTVQNVRKRAGVPTQPHGMTPADIDRAAVLFEAGLSLRKIGAAVGFDPKTVTGALKRQGRLQ